ncbi:hypothetical protein JX265_000721 [Neoarthrinium moseri]|uniref:S-adenosyl-L-methionine-dependent methyltransferase n=1 Tax=Neoarthrinium moseri TaxID=1658444 RepID=A0A9Q0AX67_9PEZI|nr:uncharacterized protein JN550_001530 [Neoarthrinium moseri]KAI1854313.1 hypothetical protein JX266_001454 [Neoarthrinium moseri]KAI1876034.1 hypothetical protein JN550_001530 [Neoarthrinium moseri]KAI1881895.1 hypothetical protein JX265_000721 [Neoarthrinium moseri]
MSAPTTKSDVREDDGDSPGQWDLDMSELDDSDKPEEEDIEANPSSGQSVYDTDSVVAESGISYHGYKPGKYYLPNDAAEQDRLDIMHVSFRLLLGGKLALAPFQEPPRYVLDVGTGTGIWAIQFAEEHLDSQVIGTDLSAIQPRLTISNCSFQRDDAEEEIWLFPVPQNRFDYVHLRFMVTCFDEPRRVMANAFEHLNPGGWIEFQDSIMPILDFNGKAEGTAIERWNQYAYSGGAALNRDFKKPSRYKEWLEETGFVDVKEHKIEWPMAPWPADARRKKAGWFLLRSLMNGFRGLSWAFLRAAGLSADEVETLVAECKKDLLNRKYAWYFGVYIVYGRKPAEGETGQSPASSSASTPS